MKYLLVISTLFFSVWCCGQSIVELEPNTYVPIPYLLNGKVIDCTCFGLEETPSGSYYFFDGNDAEIPLNPIDKKDIPNRGVLVEINGYEIGGFAHGGQGMMLKKTNSIYSEDWTPFDSLIKTTGAVMGYGSKIYLLRPTGDSLSSIRLYRRDMLTGIWTHAVDSFSTHVYHGYEPDSSDFLTGMFFDDGEGFITSGVSGTQRKFKKYFETGSQVFFSSEDDIDVGFPITNLNEIEEQFFQIGDKKFYAIRRKSNDFVQLFSYVNGSFTPFYPPFGKKFSPYFQHMGIGFSNGVDDYYFTQDTTGAPDSTTVKMMHMDTAGVWSDFYTTIWPTHHIDTRFFPSVDDNSSKVMIYYASNTDPTDFRMASMLLGVSGAAPSQVGTAHHATDIYFIEPHGSNEAVTTRKERLGTDSTTYLAKVSGDQMKFNDSFRAREMPSSQAFYQSLGGDKYVYANKENDSIIFFDGITERRFTSYGIHFDQNTTFSLSSEGLLLDWLDDNVPRITLYDTIGSASDIGLATHFHPGSGIQEVGDTLYFLAHDDNMQHRKVLVKHHNGQSEAEALDPQVHEYGDDLVVLDDHPGKLFALVYNSTGDPSLTIKDVHAPGESQTIIPLPTNFGAGDDLGQLIVQGNKIWFPAINPTTTLASFLIFEYLNHDHYNWYFFDPTWDIPTSTDFVVTPTHLYYIDEGAMYYDPYVGQEILLESITPDPCILNDVSLDFTPSPDCGVTPDVFEVVAPQSGAVYYLENEETGMVGDPMDSITPSQSYLLSDSVSLRLVAALPDTGMFLAASSNGIKMESNSDYGLSTQVTFECWVKADALPSRAILLSNLNHHAGFAFGFENGKPAFYLSDSTLLAHASSFSFPLGVWTHLAWTVSFGSQATLIINGETQEVITGLDSNPIGANGGEMWLGKNSPYIGSAWNFEGSLSDVRLWSEERTAAEIFADRWNLRSENISPDLTFWLKASPAHFPNTSHASLSGGDATFEFQDIINFVSGPSFSLGGCHLPQTPYQWYFNTNAIPIAQCLEEMEITVLPGEEYPFSTLFLNDSSYSPCGANFDLIRDTVFFSCDDDRTEVWLEAVNDWGQKDSCSGFVQVIPGTPNPVQWDSGVLTACSNESSMISFSGNSGSLVYLRDAQTQHVLSLPTQDSSGVFILPPFQENTTVELVQAGGKSNALMQGAFAVNLSNYTDATLNFSAVFFPTTSAVDEQSMVGAGDFFDVFWNASNQEVELRFAPSLALPPASQTVDPKQGIFLLVTATPSTLNFWVNEHLLFALPHTGISITKLWWLDNLNASPFVGGLDHVLIDLIPENVLPSVCTNSAAYFFSFDEENTLENTGTSSASAQIINDNFLVEEIGVPSCACSFVHQDILEVQVHPASNENLVAQDSIFLCLGESMELTSIDQEVVAWNSGSDTGAVFTVHADSSFWLNLTSLDTVGCANKDSVFVSATSLPEIQMMSDTTICRGSLLLFEATGAEEWDWSNGVENGNSLAIEENQIVYVTGTTLGCTQTDSVQITVLDAPELEPVEPFWFCEPTQVTFFAVGTGTITWSNGVENGESTWVETSEEFTVTATNSIGCTREETFVVNIEPLEVDAGEDIDACDGEFITFNATGSAPFVWSNFVDNGQLFEAYPGTYVVTVGTNTQCEVADSLEVRVHDNPTVDAGNEQEVCAGEQVRLSASGAVSYVWSHGVENDVLFSPESSTFFHVEGTDNNGCTGMDSVFVRVEALPEIHATIEDAYCGTASGSIILDIVSQVPVSVLWEDGSTEMNRFNLLPDAYEVVATTTVLSCSSTAVFEVGQYAEFSITTHVQHNVCSGDSSGVIEAFINGEQNGADYNVAWKNNAGEVLFTDVFAISNLTGGGYWFQAEKDGCIDQQFVSVSAGRWIGVDIVPLDTNENGFTISSVGANDGKIEARITNGFNDFTFRWENGEDASLLRANLGAGAYSIELTSQEGCLFSDSIRLYDPFGLDFPEAFSPNGDGLNDYFEIRGLHLVPENSLVVYNEEGIEAFSASPYANEWGGIMCEVNWPDGQYSYVFVAAGKTYRGVVLILRDEQ